MNKPRRKTRKELKREILELKASSILNYVFSSDTIKKTSIDNLMGSGIVIQLTGIGGKEYISPTLIRDGLSKETIEAIRKDIKRSHDLSISISLK